MRALKGNLSIYTMGPAARKEADLELLNVTLRFGGITALQRVVFSLKQGELVGLIGPNGAGKTSLVNCLTGFSRPQEGRILFNGQDLHHLPPHKIAEMGIARTFQETRLHSRNSVLCSILSARHIYGRYLLRQAFFFAKSVKREEAYHLRIVEELLDFLGLQAYRKTAVRDLPTFLKKRIELARALAMQPKLLVLDEPFSGLFPSEKDFIGHVLRDLNHIWGQTILLVENDMNRVFELAERVVVLDFGAKLAEGAPEFIQNHPRVLDSYFGRSEPLSAHFPA